MKAKTLMVQGTGSDVGKSVITSAFCRILAQDGYRVAPFKSQNMALNSFITRQGGEIGRAQAVQAEAAMVAPTVDMNPVLLKPNQDDNSQVIYRGKARFNMTAKDYFNKREETLQVIAEAADNLLAEYEVVVLEGAGSPAEINLREKDMVNMRMAEMVSAPVVLVADIDRGGVFASIVGTLELLTPDERERIKGIIVNKFRGQPERFADGVDFIEEYTGKPVLGVIPYFSDFSIPEEDRLARDYFGSQDSEIEIAVIYLPHMSNFTDFSILAGEPSTRVCYLKNSNELEDMEADLVIIPGSKNTIEDLQYLYRSGFVDIIKERREAGVPVVGICGGFQMLGNIIRDPLHLETEQEAIKGIGLLGIETTLKPHKVTAQTEAGLITDRAAFAGLKEVNFKGYEIHQGRTDLTPGVESVFHLKREQQSAQIADGAISEDGLVWGTYLHGLFDNDDFRRHFINYLRQRKGLRPLAADCRSARAEREQAYNRLADLVRKNINMDLFYDII